VKNIHHSARISIFCCVGAFLGTLFPSTTARGTALDDYVSTPDPSFSWGLNSTAQGIGYKAHILKMYSQTWRSTSEVNHTVWEHWLVVVVPNKVSRDTALLWIDGGSWNSPAPNLNLTDPNSEYAMIGSLAVATQSVVAILLDVPNEPLNFLDEPGRYRSEDAIIAYSYDKFLDPNSRDPNTWPALLPMVKSAVRGMDTVQAFCQSPNGGGVVVNKFMVGGGSKRGWTTWLTGAYELGPKNPIAPRVVAIVPVVIDLLRLDYQMDHHFAVYDGVTNYVVSPYPVQDDPNWVADAGKFSIAVGDYVEMNVMSRLHTPRGQELGLIVDPYQYRSRFANTPKFLLNSSGDQFFVSDSAQFYLSDLPGETKVRYVPNTGHGVGDSSTDAFDSLSSFYVTVLDPNFQRPSFSWTIQPDASIRVRADTLPYYTTLQVRLWTSSNTVYRDFRYGWSGASSWTSTLLADQGAGVYVGSVAKPPVGWSAYFVELTYQSYLTGLTQKYTTQIKVIPDMAILDLQINRALGHVVYATGSKPLNWERPTYLTNKVITVSAVVDDPNYDFKQWQITLDPNHYGDANYVVTDPNNPLTIKMDVSHRLAAVFASEGTLTVSTEPVGVNGEIIVDGTSWGTGTQTRQVSVGQHTVAFGDVAGYIKPANQQVAVQKGQTTSVTGIYTWVGDTGTLSVTTAPVSGEVIVDGTSWGTAPQSRQVQTGQHTVTFGGVAGYSTPGPQVVTVQKNLTTAVTGTYLLQQLGTLAVSTTPVAGEVFVDGNSWGLAPQSRQVSVGAHTVSFGPVSGYTTPASQQVTIINSQTNSITGTYAAIGDAGTLTINTTPVAGEAFVDGLSWGTVPQTRVIAIGSHTVTFGSIPGYTTPAGQTAQVIKSQTTLITGVYVQQTGRLSVTTDPVGGPVIVDGVPWGNAPQEANVPVGSHTVSFGPLAGYASPSAQQVTIQDGQTTAITGTYTQDTGTLSVAIEPNSLSGHVIVDGDDWGAAPQSKLVAVGSHKINFGDVVGYAAPGEQQATVQKDQTTTVTGTYVQDTGILSIRTEPNGVNGEVFVDGKSWGLAPQSNAVGVGPHTVSFGTVPGYTTPVPQQVTILKGQTLNIKGTYALEVGTLTVSTAPAGVNGEVFVDGQSWGVAPQSRAIPTGTHTISFGEVQGYLKPADIQVTIPKNGNVAETGTYIRRLSVTAVADPNTIVTGNSSSIAASVVGGTTPYTYSWNTVPVQTGSNITVNPTEPNTYSYTVTVTDGGTPPQTATATATVKVVLPELAASATANPTTIASGQSSALNALVTGGKGPYTYAWSTGQTGQNITVSPTTTTTYTVIVTDSASNSVSASVGVTVASGVWVTAQASRTIIPRGGSSTLTAGASGGFGLYAYRWSTGETSASITVSPRETTTYTVQAADSLGQTGEASVQVSVAPGITAGAIADPNTVPAGGKSTLTALATGGEGTLSYRWTPWEPNDPNATLMQADVRPTKTTSYTVTISDSLGQAANASVTVTVASAVAVTASAAPTLIAQGGKCKLTATATGGMTPYSYRWEPGDPNDPNASVEVRPTEPSTVYTVTVTDALNQTAEANVVVSVADIPQVICTAEPNTIALGKFSTLTVSASGGKPPYSYLWDNGLTGNSISVNPTKNTTYTVTCTDSLGQKAEGQAAVTVVGPLSVTASADPNTLVVGAFSQIRANPSGGLLPYTYRWNNGRTEASFSDNPTSSRTYAVTVTDAAAQTATASVSVTVQQQYTLNAYPYEQGTGDVELLPAGGTYVQNTQVSLTARPRQGYQFAFWSGDLSESTNVTDASVSVTMDSNKNVIAVFTLIKQNPGPNNPTLPCGVSVGTGQLAMFWTLCWVGLGVAGFRSLRRRR
jgi:PhoPQ-activated pathogenicity-related protein